MRIIAGLWKGHQLNTLRGREVRPTTDRIRESWMAALGSDLEGANVLDLFAGSGALGLEALSRGAKSAVFVERSRRALKVLRSNVERLGAASKSTVISLDAISYTKKLDGVNFDIAFADPPYGRGLASLLLESFATDPFAHQLWVEHRINDSIIDLEGLRQRFYGDTVISILEVES